MIINEIHIISDNNKNKCMYMHFYVDTLYVYTYICIKTLYEVRG